MWKMKGWMRTNTVLLRIVSKVPHNWLNQAKFNQWQISQKYKGELFSGSVLILVQRREHGDKDVYGRERVIGRRRGDRAA